MEDVPPLMTPEFDLDGVTVTLEAADSRRGVLLTLLALGLFVPVVAIFVASSVMGVVVGFFALAFFALASATSAGQAELQLEITRGHLRLEDREFETWDVARAYWECSPPTTRLMLERQDGSVEEVAHVRRQTRTGRGITRKQRDWIADLVTNGMEPTSAADIPDGLQRLRRGQTQ